MKHVERRYTRVLIVEGATTDVQRLSIPAGEYDCEISTVVNTYNTVDIPSRPSFSITLHGIPRQINKAVSKGLVSEITNPSGDRKLRAMRRYRLR